jgi:hypothetical protein
MCRESVAFMTDNIVPLPADLEVERALRTLSRDPAAKARATSILRDELRGATPLERSRLIALISLLEQARPAGPRH